MREIATEAGVALGSAYYYFESKEARVIAFYEQASDEMFGSVEGPGRQVASHSRCEV